MVTFRTGGGECPYYIANGIKYFIQDRNAGGGTYEYSLQCTDAKTERIKMDSLENAVKYLGCGWWNARMEYEGIYTIHLEGKIYVFNDRIKALWQLKEPLILTGWYDSYRDCLKASKEIVEREIGQQISFL